MSRALRFIVHIGLLLSTGCASIEQFLSTPSAPPPISPTPIPVISTPEETQVANATSTAPATSQPRILRIWLPPRFDPNAATSAASLFRQRLADFEADHPGLELEVRIKAD
ncbi:MAG TPA: hypothetical protein VJM08_06875, partial [Anaerolineales bacterium]|nr:hypothetical protein [Anaerolineales bacterium]